MFTILCVLPAVVLPSGAAPSTSGLEENIIAAAHDGRISCRITTPEEFKAVIGTPQSEDAISSDGQVVVFTYADGTQAGFRRPKDGAPFTLVGVIAGNRMLELGKPHPKNNEELHRLDSFAGLQDVSLAALDLRSEREFLEKLPFDTLTEWPPVEKMPDGFNPPKIIENGKNPGLGLRALHAAGLDGRGVTIGIIDQPMLTNHAEYSSSLAFYDAAAAGGAGPQMHGPAVASFAVGKNIGSAPGSRLYHFALPMTSNRNNDYQRILKEIMARNSGAAAAEKIRVVSISDGMMREEGDYSAWHEAFLEAENNGILILTCETENLNLGVLTRDSAIDPEDPTGYKPDPRFSTKFSLWLPGSMRTRASEKGRDVYAFDHSGGRSWTTPYLAGLAAIGFQIYPEMSPAKARELILRSSLKMPYGLIVSPHNFIELVKREAARGNSKNSQ